MNAAPGLQCSSGELRCCRGNKHAAVNTYSKGLAAFTLFSYQAVAVPLVPLHYNLFLKNVFGI